MSLKDLVKRKKDIMATLHESLDSGQAGSIDPNRNQKTGLTFWHGAHELRTEKIYEDSAGNLYCYKLVENDSTQQTGDIKMQPDLNIVKDKDGNTHYLKRQYLKESENPYDPDNVNESAELDKEEDSRVNETQDIIDGLNENESGNEPIISDEEEKEIKESEDILGGAGMQSFVEEYRVRATEPTPEREQNNYGINHITVEVDGKAVSVYESEEHEDLVKSVIETVSSELSKRVDEADPETGLSQGE